MKNFKGYLSESIVQNNFKVGDVVIATDKNVVENERFPYRVSPYEVYVELKYSSNIIPGNLYKVTSVDKNNNRISIEKSIYWFDMSCFEPIDEPEETNYEEWVEESNDGRELRVGDKVLNTYKGKYSYSGTIYKFENEICTITDISSSVYLRVESTGYISKFCHPANWRDYLTIIDDEPEETNYEEWLEESYEQKLKVGDQVVIRKDLESDRYYKRPGITKSGIFCNYKMVEYRGKIAKIVGIDTDSNYSDADYYLNGPFGIDDWVWDRNMFEPIDDEPEETNYEEWLEEAKLQGFKYGDKVICIDNSSGCRSTLTVGKTYTINSEKQWRDNEPFVTIMKNDLGDSMECFSKRFIKKREDEPEDSNMEEWVEESSKRKLRVGDLVIVKPNYHPSRWDGCGTDKDRTARIITIRSDYMPGLEFLNRPTEYGHDCNGYGKDGWCMWLDSRFFDVIDEEEDSNYEEWVEESKEDTKFKVGDKVLIKNNLSSFWYTGKDAEGKVGIITKVLDLSSGPIYFIDDNKYRIDFYDRNLELYDDTEKTNYEEWLEEGNGDRYGIGDTVIVRRTYDNDLNFLIGKIGKVMYRTNDLDNTNFWAVTFDEVFPKLIEYNNRKLSESRYNRSIANLLKMISERNIYFFNGDQLELYDNELEETNYEEWNEKTIIKYEEF